MSAAPDTATTAVTGAVRLDPPRPRAVADPAWRATAAAGLLLAAGLAVVLAGAGAAVALAVTAAGAALALVVLVPRGAAAVRRQPALLLGALVPFAPFALVAAALVAGAFGLVPYWADLELVALLVAGLVVGIAAGGGVVLLAEAVRGRLGPGGAGRTPWDRLAGPARPVPVRAGRAVAGVALVALAGAVGLALADALLVSGGLGGVLLLLVVGAGAVALVAAPVAVAGVAGADRSRVAEARDDERQRMAAHLHDSVLQTLALIQRQAHDPAAVARLARRQEHGLRAWMAGEAELGAETVASGLREAVAEVEDDHGASVEVTLLGDRPLDPAGEALVAAAREALRNAARHAPGAPVHVFAQIGRDGVEAYVRDDGPGFALDDVATERRGVRDAIIGRMASVGGRATIDSEPGEGTEVALRVGAGATP